MCLSLVMHELLWLMNINLILVWIPNILLRYPDDHDSDRSMLVNE